jgi:hypothetical protein
MGAGVVVVVEPALRRVWPVLVCGEWLAVGPLTSQDAVEAFDLAVLPRAVWLGESVFDAAGGERVDDGMAVR